MAKPTSKPSLYNTHAVTNQPPVLVDYDAFSADLALVEALDREGGRWVRTRAEALGRRVGSAEVIELARHANRFAPELRTHDRFGNRIDEVASHPAWHTLMALGIEHLVHALPWRETRPGADVGRAALAFLLNQGENGVCCPMAMTFAAVPALRQEPLLAQSWEPRITSERYDPRFVPPGKKSGAVFGMAMTEKQGGSDVQANTTTARPSGDGYFLTGHKWFCSAPMSDAFLTLAQAPGGLTCFLVPRWKPDDTRNAFHIQRLKDKLGNRSNASAEIEYLDTWAARVGPEGEGIRTIISMVHHTRLDAAISAAAVMRSAVVQALHHAAHRSAFGARLADQPLMRNVLADLALESEAATVLAMRLSRAFDDAKREPETEAFVRLATAIVKFWICKRAPVVVAEALECLGGNGYVEESVMPRLYREAPVNGIWEGTGNVICLDILRTLARVPEALPMLRDELKAAKGGNAHLDAFVRGLDATLPAAAKDPASARGLVEKLALAWQAALLAQHAPAAVADAFCTTRLEAAGGRTLGTLPAGSDTKAIMGRAWPV